MITAEQTIQLVEFFDDPSDSAALKSRELTLGLLLHTPFPFTRHQFTPGHITVTGLVIAPDGERVLLVHHARLNRWLLPGGHVEESDKELWKAAAREVVEETGVALDLSSGGAKLAGVDVHGIPPNIREPYHQHHDLLFHFRAAADDYRLSHESRAVAWAYPASFDFYDLPPNTRLAYRRVTGK